MANSIVIANSNRRRPGRPPMKTSGTKAAASDSEIETTVKPISRAPVIAASNGPRPFSRLRYMFSIMTMASSMTNPTAMASAISVRLLIEKPASAIAPSVPAIESGTVMPAAMVGARRRRKRNTTSITRTTESSSVSSMSCTEARMVCVRSDITSMSMPPGIRRLSSGISAFTPSTASMTLASGCLVMKSTTAGWRL